MRVWAGLTVFLCLSSQAFGWGNIGHEAVGIIAEQNLEPAVKRQVQTLLESGGLKEAAIWPDQVKNRREWHHTATYHYTSIPDSSNYLENLSALDRDTQENGDILRAMVIAEDTLRNSRESKVNRANALRFLVHLVGDLHQPLHVGRADDRGGNDLKLKWFGKEVNLHALWDTYIIQTFMNPKVAFLKEADADNSADYVAELPSPTARDVSDWQNSYILTWLDESQGLRSTVYSDYKSNNQVYYNRNVNYVHTRILQAGYRLAALLNAIFKNAAFQPESAKNLRDHLHNILGVHYDRDVLLTPQTGNTLRSGKIIIDLCDHGDEHDHQ